MSDVVNEVATMIKQIDGHTKRAKDMIKFAEAAGEDVSKQKGQLMTIIAKTDRWRNAVREQGGIDIPKIDD